MGFLNKAARYLSQNKRLWLPQLIITVVLLLALLLFTQNPGALPSLYRIL